MKNCKKCNTIKDSDDFYKNSRSKDGLDYLCKVCNNKRSMEWAARNPDKVKAKTRRLNIKKDFGITEAEYDQRMADQTGPDGILRCAICLLALDESQQKCLDHSHATGKIRKFLCRWCNAGLGNFKDSWIFLDAASKYILENC
jgi:hypothetical protein